MYAGGDSSRGPVESANHVRIGNSTAQQFIKINKKPAPDKLTQASLVPRVYFVRLTLGSVTGLFQRLAVSTRRSADPNEPIASGFSHLSKEPTLWRVKNRTINYDTGLRDSNFSGSLSRKNSRFRG